MFKITKPKDVTAQDARSVDAFIEAAHKTPAERRPSGRARLIFALDATMSRQPTWDLAIGLQSRMFAVTEALGGLDIQLVYFRGQSECRASPFLSGGAGLARYMQGIRVAGGSTQICRVLAHARDEALRERVGALVYVGDAVEESLGALRSAAGHLGLLGTKLFMFQEGRSRSVSKAFKTMAQATGGVHAAFDASAPDVLMALLTAAAAYAAGGIEALEALERRSGNAETARLLAQLR